ncbi:SDR family NAD(P)-dependent oxidoreductase [Streptomyces sp. Agncl-13]|uniref:SDR family NAD(P)-dependent oxidoreductase n=1 Tax=Streptomyces sp. Agncl-13 TaxID=3400628 RepID=UPI003A876520
MTDVRGAPRTKADRKGTQMSKTWYITGTSRGLGRTWATAALQRGDRVAATARDIHSLSALKSEFGDAVLPVELDVTDRSTSQAAIQKAHAHFGRLDVVVNNAGYSHFGFVEEVNEAEARAQMETNFFGALWTTQAAIPLLRHQGGGHIVQVSSSGGVIAFPSLGIYSASKWALEGLTEALAAEVAGFGIRTTLIEPSAYSTDGPGVSAVRSNPNPLYQPIRDAVATAMDPATLPAPSATVAAVLAVIDAEQPPTRLVLGSSTFDQILPTHERRLKTWRDWESVTRSADA